MQALQEMADLLELQEASAFRINAYRRAAQTVAQLSDDVVLLARGGGAKALNALPDIGPSIAMAIVELAHTGRLSRLERLRGTLDPVQVFASLPGIGLALANAIHDALHVETLEELETAAHDGRLEAVPGMGPARVTTVRAVLAERLSRQHRSHCRPARAPSASVLLEADREYRRLAGEGALRCIAPRRFNPDRRAWLPILHVDRDGWHLTLLFSNTARAHQLAKTDDWVVVYYDDNDHHDGQCTVVTETSGPRKGQRVVRGLEGAA